MSSIRILPADYGNQQHAAAIIRLMEEYAMDPMGGSHPLPEYTRLHLVEKLAAFPGAFSFLAYTGELAVGLANCFTGFSTFSCRPLINLHDLAVSPCYRGQQVGSQLLLEVEAAARQRGACKLTLEVLGGNERAQSVYRKFGFEPYQLDPGTGTAQFWQKTLTDR